MMQVSPPASQVWYNQLEFVTKNGDLSAPRKIKTLEVLGSTVDISMRYPVTYHPKRGLSYLFMASEALWIISGSKRLDFNQHIRDKLARFSDDGETMSGAYGVSFIQQASWAVNKLAEDPDSRQAVIQIWKPLPVHSKDIPCTVALQFLIRNDTLHTNVFMRSSDVWLGLPYDLFNFSIMSMVIALQSKVGRLGNLTVLMGSSHLYEENFGLANELLVKGKTGLSTNPWDLGKIKSTERLMDLLMEVTLVADEKMAMQLLSLGSEQ